MANPLAAGRFARLSYVSIGAADPLAKRDENDERNHAGQRTQPRKARTSTQHARHDLDEALLVRELGQDGCVRPLLQNVGACVSGVKDKGNAAV